jgi:hypothetical protein
MPRGKVKTIETLEDADMRIQRLDAGVKSLREQLAAIDPPSIERATRSMQEEANRIHGSMGVMILKLSVLTEVPRYLRKRNIPPNVYFPKMLPLFELPDEWWRRRGNMNMDGWCELIASADVQTFAE